MPKKRSADDYAADGGFVVDAPSDVDDDDDDQVMPDRPPPGAAQARERKKLKVAGGRGSSGGGTAAPVSKGKGRGEMVPGGGAKDKDGHEYWEISGKRRVQISAYSGKQMINIREFYEDKKSGDMLPGKKGISLTTEQFDTIISLLPHIESVLAGKGHRITRPEYGDRSSMAVEDEDVQVGNADDDEDEEEEEEDKDVDEDEDEEEDERKQARGKKLKMKQEKKRNDKKKKRKNFEETSEED